MLVAYADGGPGCLEWLTGWLRNAASALAPDGVRPTRGARAALYRAVILAAAELRDSQARRVTTRSFLDKVRLAALTREAHATRPLNHSTHRLVWAPGPELRRLAVDRRLARAASRALGFRVEPAFVAVYMHDPPRSHVPPHLDASAYEVIVHVVLEHRGRRGPRGGSALVVHRPYRDARLDVAPGQTIVLSGRGAVHQWERLGAREDRLLVGIGFKAAKGHVKMSN